MNKKALSLNGLIVAKYPVLFEQSGKMEAALANYKLARSGHKLKLEIASDKELGPVAMRLGPFEKPAGASSVRVNGQIPTETSIQRSGDWWWIGFTFSVGRPIAEINLPARP